MDPSCLINLKSEVISQKNLQPYKRTYTRVFVVDSIEKLNITYNYHVLIGFMCYSLTY